MTAKNLPSPELLRKLLRYEPNTGKLYWRERTPDMFVGGKRSSEWSCKAWNGKHAGKEALTSLVQGYQCGPVFGKPYLAHRVIWAIWSGDWPSEQLDHINGDRCDNRIENLRSVSHAENGRNQKLRVDSSSGACGVYWNKRSHKWHAQININNVRKHLGFFIEKSDAIAARKEAEDKYGFHANHGRQT